MMIENINKINVNSNKNKVLNSITEEENSKIIFNNLNERKINNKFSPNNSKDFGINIKTNFNLQNNIVNMNSGNFTSNNFNLMNKNIFNKCNNISKIYLSFLFSLNYS